jgi:hypothetical protein
LLDPVHSQPKSRDGPHDFIRRFRARAPLQVTPDELPALIVKQ